VFDVPPAYTKRYRKHSTRRGKSDAIDARAIAEVVLRDVDRLGRFFGEGAHDELRLYYDCRDRLVRDRSQALNRVRHAAFRLSITELPKALHRPLALAKLRAQLDRIEVNSAVSQALVTELRFGVQAIEMLNEQIAEVERILRPLVRHLRQLSELVGVSTVVAAGIAGHAGDLRNCRNADAFAMRSATAPVPCSSGQNQSLRVNTGGNRQLNRLLYVIAWNQIRRADHPGRVYYDRKRSEGKSPRAAMRALKRRLATVVYLRLVADMRTASTASQPQGRAA
jgi:transposase